MKQARFLYFFNDRGHFRRFLTGMTIVTLLAGIGLIFVPDAWAAFTCSGGSGNGNLFDQDTIGNVINDASGNAYTINTATATTNGDPYGTACPANLGIFGTILCFFKVTVGQIVSNMYCTIQQNFLVPFSVAIELFIVIFGVTVMTGMIRLTPREAIMGLLKVALVWMFATNATWGIGIGYSFFMGIAEEGSNLVLNAVGTASGTSASGGGGYLTQPDNMLSNALSLISTGSGSTASFFPATLTTVCAVWLMAFVVLLLLFVPMVGGFLITMMIQYVMLYVRAMLGYLTSLVLISFMFILSPIFICFALFQITRPMFEQWFRYILSFSLQMVIIFAFLVLLQLIPIGAFFSEMVGLLREYDSTTSSFTYPLPMTFCSVCDGYQLGTGNITDTPPPITCPSTGGSGIPIGKLFLDTDLVQAVLSQIVALWIVGVVMQDFLQQAPALAAAVTGGMPMLSMGGDATGGQGVQFMGIDSGYGDGGQYAIDSPEAMANIRDRVEGFRQQAASRAAPAALTLMLGLGASSVAGGLAMKNRPGNAGSSSGSGSGSSSSSSLPTGMTVSRSGKMIPMSSSGSGSGASAGATTSRSGSVPSTSTVTSTTVSRGAGGAVAFATTGGDAGSVIRPTLTSTTAMMATASRDQQYVLGATEYLRKVNSDNSAAVTNAVQVAEKYQNAEFLLANSKAKEDAQNVIANTKRDNQADIDKIEAAQKTLSLLANTTTKADALKVLANTKRDSQDNIDKIDAARQTVAEYDAASGLVADKRAYNEALATLRSANDTWMAAMTNLTARNAAVLKKQEAASEVVPGTVSSGVTPNKNIVTAMSKEQVRDQVNISLDNLELQLRAQRALIKPVDRTLSADGQKAEEKKLQANLDRLDTVAAALKEVNDASITAANMGSAEGMSDVIDHLQEIEKMLIIKPT